MEYDAFLDSSDHRADYVRKCSDRMAVEICKSYKFLDISNAHKGRLILNSFNFLEVHADAFGRNDQS